MSQVQVNLFATLRSHIGGAPSIELEIEPGQTIEDVLDELGVPTGQTRILFLNNRAAGLHDELHDGDQLAVFPALGGG